MKAADFIAFARILLTLPAAQCPAGYRSITSRLYYGVYHVALEFIESELGFPHRKADDNNNKHQFIIDYLVGSNEDHAMDLATQLGQLHELRKVADYRIADKHFEKDNTKAIESVTRVDRIIRTIDACREPTARNNIQNGMSVYRKRRSSPSHGI